MRAAFAGGVTSGHLSTSCVAPDVRRKLYHHRTPAACWLLLAPDGWAKHDWRDTAVHHAVPTPTSSLLFAHKTMKRSSAIDHLSHVYQIPYPMLSLCQQSISQADSGNRPVRSGTTKKAGNGDPHNLWMDRCIIFRQSPAEHEVFCRLWIVRSLRRESSLV